MKAFRRWFDRRAIEQRMREEMKFHLDARTEALMARGMSREEAARTARLEFGSPEGHREECRAALGFRPWDELRSDIRFAARSLRNHPGYAVTTIGILALAIGVNGAFFTLYSHHVLKPLPIRSAERHFDLRGLDTRARSTGGWTTDEIEILRQASRTHIEDLYTARTIQELVLEPEQRLALVSFVSDNYFRLLGGSAASGRTLPEQERHEPVVVLSHSGQRRHFAEDPTPIGNKVRIRNTVFTVIGVMPPEFTGTETTVPDFWASAEMAIAVRGRESAHQPRYNLSGLLAPDVSLTQAEAVLTAAAARFSRTGDEPIVRVHLKKRSGFVSADAELNTAAASFLRRS